MAAQTISQTVGPGPDCSHQPRRHAARHPLAAALCQLLSGPRPAGNLLPAPALNERERQGLIKAFEYCFELGWNTLRDLLLAFRVGLIGDGEAWLAMVQDRNLTSHTYNRSTAEQVSQQVQATAADEGDG